MGRVRGLAYNPASVRVATQRLEQLGVFRRVEYLGLAGRGDWREGVLRWRVEEPRYNTFEGAVGVQGAAGVVGLARLELGNLLGTARSMSLSWQSRGRGLADFGARYVEPMMFGRALRWEGALQQQIQDTLFTRFRWGARASVALGGRLHAEAGFEEERVVQSHDAVRDADAQNTSFALERDGRDDARDPATRHANAARGHAGLHARDAAAAAGPAGSGSRRHGQRAAVRGRVAPPAAARTRCGAGVPRGRALQFRPRAGRVAALARGRLGLAARSRRGGVPRGPLRALAARVAVLPRARRGSARRCSGTTRTWRRAARSRRRRSRSSGSRPTASALGLRLPAAGGDVDLDYGVAPGRGVLEGKIHLRLVTAF